MLQKKMKQWVTFGLAAVMTVTAVFGFGLTARAEGNEAAAEEEINIDDDTYLGITFKDEEQEDKDAEVLTFSKDAAYIRSNNFTTRNGIDVSHWQNDEGAIDWKAVKDSGVEYVIVKVAGRHHQTGALYYDSCYENNIIGAQAVGLKVGAYFFSQAQTVAEAKEEADYLVGLASKYQMELPLFMDLEGIGNEGYRITWASDSYTSMAIAFCDEVASYGYCPGFYSSSVTIAKHMNGEEIAKHGKMWIANHSYKPNEDPKPGRYSGPYEFHQHTSDGSVPGITGRVDLDYWYDDGTISSKDYSKVFDADYYYMHQEDVAASVGAEPSKLLAHFINAGMKEGRQGSASFNVHAYMDYNPDLVAQFGNDYVKYYEHYMQTGYKENRNCTYETSEEETECAMYRMYNPNSGEHFYTSNTTERMNLVLAGWNYEGIAWYAPERSTVPVYRLYNPNAGDHHYTTSEVEKESLKKTGWKYEGIGWYSDDSKGTNENGEVVGNVKLYRLYNPNAIAGAHHYTIDKGEADVLVNAGWQAEGIGWYGK